MVKKRSLSLILIVAMLIQVWSAVGIASAAPSGPEVNVSTVGGPILNTTYPMNGGTMAATDSFTLTFSEVVYAATGSIHIIRSGGDGAAQVIPAQSASVTGSGTAVIKIQPPVRLDPSVNYYVLIDTQAFVDQSGTAFAGYLSDTNWTFQTLATTISPPVLAPVTGTTGVLVNSTLTMTFASPMHAGSGNIRLKKKATGATVIGTDTPVTNAMLSVGEKVLTLKVSALEPNTQYYVQIDSGALLNANNEPYLGFTDEASWSFTTVSDSTSPIVSQFTPTTNGAHASPTGALSIKFNEAVYLGSGAITIRNSNNTLFCSIPVEGLGGGGTDTITIPPCASFVSGSSYSVQIAATAFRDASNNYYAGIAANNYSTWRFSVSTDVRAPELVATDPVNDAANIRRNGMVLTATFNEAVQITPGGVATLHSQAGSILSTIPLIMTSHATDAKIVYLTVPTTETLAVNTGYYVNIANGAIKDAAGNSFQGIMNSYRWAFKTIQSDRTAPALSTVSISGNGILLTYDQELDSTKTLIPSAAQFYVTVNGVARTVTAVEVTGQQVKLTVTSGVSVGQAVRVAFTNGAPGKLQNLGSPPVLAESFAAKDVTKSTDTTVPRPISGTISGTTLTLTFNKALAAVTGSYPANQLYVRLNGTAVTPTSVYASGSNLILTLPSTYQGTGAVTVTYSPGAAPFKDTLGNVVAAFSEFSITNTSGTGALQITYGLASDYKVTLAYSKSLNTGMVPYPTSFNVLVNGNYVSITSVNVNGNLVELTLNQPIAIGASVSVSYMLGSLSLTDTTGIQAAAFSGYVITAGQTSTSGLSVLSTNVNGSTLSINFSAALNSAYIPTTAQFIVKANNANIGISSVTVSGSQVMLQLSSAIQTGQVVTVSYYASGVKLTSMTNQEVASFSDLRVSNTGSVQDTMPAYLISDGASGYRFNSTAVVTSGTATTTAGRTVNRYMLNGDHLKGAYTWLKEAGSTIQGPVLSLQIPSYESAAVVQMPIYSLLEAGSKVTNGKIRVEYGDLQFEFPLSAIDYSKEVAALGGNISNASLEIVMEKTTNANLSSMILSHSGVIQGTPINFNIRIVAAGKQQEVTTFDQYVTRTIILPTSAATQLSQLTVVRIDESNGALSYVPTIVESLSSGVHVHFKRKGNSTYAVVRKAPTVYSDITNHWAKDEIALLASKWIVSGPTATTYKPNASITRADFAKYIASGLGLSGNASAASRFRDVGANGVDAAYIGAVSEAGIISGKTNGNFDPNAPITREEMTSMMLRAMSYTGVQPSKASLNHFTDSSKIGSWAVDSVAACVEAGIISGVTPVTFQPKANATRAQAAIMIVKMLQYSELLQE